MVAGFLGNPGMNFIAGRLANGGGGLRFEGGSVAVELSAAAASAGASGQAVTLGIRPESVEVGEDAADGATIHGNIFATEPVGSDLFLDVLFEDEASDGVESHLFKVRARPDLKVRVGERIPLCLPHANLYLFDDAGHRIHPE